MELLEVFSRKTFYLLKDSRNVTCHHVTMCHSTSRSPILPGTTSKVISEKSPGSLEISEIPIITPFFTQTDIYASLQ
eukprot:680549-Amorphochlora_amoeboformis.AAC.1